MVPASPSKANRSGRNSVGRELGVRYIVEGSVRRAGQRLRLTVQLIDAGSSRHLWSEHYDSDMTDLFTVQDKIVESIAGALHPKIWAVEIERARLKRPENLQAYDYVLRGYPGFLALEDPAHAHATEMFHMALELEPELCIGHGAGRLVPRPALRQADGWLHPNCIADRPSSSPGVP